MPLRILEIAADEAMIVAGEGDDAAVSLEDVRAVALDEDPHAYIADDTHAWTIWRMSLDEGKALLAALSALPWPEESFTQGRMAGVPVRIVREEGQLLIALSSVYDATFEREAAHAGALLEHPPGSQPRTSQKAPR